jgi:DNA-damage-inducible protein D
MSDLTLFDVENIDNDQFELSCHENGTRYWLASELSKMLGYTDYKTFTKSINKAMTVCSSLNMQIMDHFKPLEKNDFKLTRFACFLITMNADIKKEKVAKAQVYFASLADVIQEYIEQEQIERIEIRSKIKEKNNSLMATAKLAGVINYANFINAGYMGMYNMSINELRRIKGITDIKKSPLDFMGSREMAANLFRLSETEAKIKSDKIYGQKNSENAAKEVGKKVRKIMIDNDGVRPEILARQRDLEDVKKDIKGIANDYKKIDGKKKKDDDER